MKKLILGAALAVAASMPALAQVAVQIEPEVREYIIREGRSSVVIDHDVVVGTVLPEEVELYAVEDVPAERPYHYAVVNDHRVIVEPETRRVIEVID